MLAVVCYLLCVDSCLVCAVSCVVGCSCELFVVAIRFDSLCVVVRCALCVEYCRLVVAWRLLCVVCCWLLNIACCLVLFVICGVLSVGCCSVVNVSCVLWVV